MALLSPEALQRIWQVLRPSLPEPLTPETELLLDLFCRAYQIDPDELGHILKASRFLVRAAAILDLPASSLAEDLDRLCPDDPLVKEILLAGYEAAKVYVRRSIALAALADHGSLLTAVKWRVDVVQGTSGAPRLKLPVALLTLHYQEGPDPRRLTLQMLPDMVRELEAACETMLG